MSIQILQGDCREVLKTIDAGSVQCVVTSPPYFGLRSYNGGDAEIGLEATPAAYVAALVDVFRQVWRVLRTDGTVWLNLGDSYCGGAGIDPYRKTTSGKLMPPQGRGGKVDGLKPKDLIGIPWRVAFALQEDGWWLRSDIIWNKPNCMPESVQDRPTRSHEYLFLLSKSARYFYDKDAIAEPMVKGAAGSTFTDGKTGVNGLGRVSQAERIESGTRNKRTVWTIPTRPFSGAHYAVMPEALVEPCILAGSSSTGACSECGAPWERIVERVGERSSHGDNKVADDARGCHGETSVFKTGRLPVTVTAGWQPTCPHLAAPVRPCVVLDPFFGSGTVGRVADRHGRDAIGIELNPEYLKQINERTNNVQTSLVGHL